MMSDNEVQAHIEDYKHVLEMVHAEPGIPNNREHEVAMTIMIVNEIHLVEHLHHRRPA